MKHFTFLIAAVWLAAMLPISAVGQTTAPPQAQALSPKPTPAPTEAPKCHAGPITKTFGDMHWLVYSCDDNRTVFIVADADNPAKPFYFTFAPGAGHYRLHGEGTGDREATKAAFEELKALSKQDLDALIAETKTVTKP